MAPIYSIFLALLLVTAIQGTPQLNEQDVVTEMKEWISNKLLGALKDLQNAEQDLRESLEKAIANSNEELQVEYTNSILEYHSHKENIHPTCFDQGLTEFLQMQVPQVMPNTLLPSTINFDEPDPTPKPTSCIMMVVEDVALMFYKTAKYTASILNTLDDILNGFGQCAVTWFKHLTCIFSYMSTAVADVYNTVKGVFDLMAEIAALGQDIHHQLTNCTNQKKFEIRQHMLFKLNNAHKCTNMYNYKE